MTRPVLVLVFVAGLFIPHGIRAALASGEDAAVVAVDASVTPLDAGVPAAPIAPAPAAAAVCPPGLPVSVAADGAITCGVPAPVSVPTDPIAEIGAVEKLYRSGAFVDVGILVAFFLLTFLSSRVPLLQRDHYAAIVSAVLGGLALLVVPALAGATPNAAQIIGAVATAATLLVNPKLPAAMAAKRGDA